MSVCSSFNRAANSYDTHCDLQQLVGDRLIAKLQAYCRQANSIVDVGCGTGLITQKLFAAYQTPSFHALDIAEALLAKAKIRLPHHITFHTANFDFLDGFLEPVDVIFSNMALHWSTNLNAAIKSLTTSLHSQGYIAFSMPTVGTFTELKWPIAKMHFQEPEAIILILQNNGYEILSAFNEKLTLPFSDTLSALRSIKQVGANHVNTHPHQGLRGKNFLQHVDCRALSYVISYFIARKTTS